jgi:hypothetical protein
MGTSEQTLSLTLVLFLCSFEEDGGWILLSNYVMKGHFYAMESVFYVIRCDIYVIKLFFYVIVLIEFEIVFLGGIKLLFPG